MRPKPTILLETRDENYDATQIIDAEAVYVICYKGKPIGIRKTNILVNYPGPKYLKSSFTNSAHAFNRRDKLNHMFNTTDFSIMTMEPGKTVERDIQPKSTQKLYGL
tara:strand:- start:1343 stop:1663 length:321 start_codon:yes stop_codon:yes gene_type:complete